MGVESLILIRHGESEYNRHRSCLKRSEVYVEFYQRVSSESSHGNELDSLAARLIEANKEFQETEPIGLSAEGRQQAAVTASKLKTQISIPDVIYTSPFRRAVETLECMTQNWSALKSVPTVEDERLGEQKHGSFLQYGDWKLFCYYHPEQRDLRKNLGRYSYRFPEGESIADVRERTQSFLKDIGLRKSQRVMIVSHDIAILTMRANLENLTEKELMDYYENNKLWNCGVTVYRQNKRQELDNSRLY